MAGKSRVSYPSDLKQAAKAGGQGLVTISVRRPDGTLVEEQGVMSPEQCRFAVWAAALLFCPEVRKVPDLEQIVMSHIDPQTKVPHPQ